MTPTDIGHNRGWLDAPAAASLARVDKQLGRPLDVNDAGRTWQEQYDAWVKYQNGGNLALHPDNPLARHTKGLAVDTDDRLPWIGEHGWVADIPGEPWHHEYRAWLDQHLNDTPAPTPNPESEEDDDMPKNSGFYYTRAKDKAVVCMVVNTGSGFISEHTNGKTTNGDYNNPVAGAYDTGSWAPISESHANAIKASLRAVQRVEISIPEPVEIV